MNLGNLQIAQSNAPYDVLGHLGDVLQISDTLQQHQETRRVRQQQAKRQQTAQGILQQSVDPQTGQINHEAAIAGLNQAGLTDEAMQYQGHYENLRKTQAETQKFSSEAGLKTAEEQEKNLITAKGHLDLMKTNMDHIAGLLDSAANEKDPQMQQATYKMAQGFYKTMAPTYGLPADYLPDNPDPEKLKSIKDTFIEHGQGYQQHVKNQIDMNAAGIKDQKARMEFNAKYDFGTASSRTGIGAARTRIANANQALSILNNPQATAADMAAANQLVLGMPFEGTPSTLYGDATKTLSYLNGKAISEVPQSKRQHAIDVLKGIKKEALKEAHTTWEGAKKVFPEYADIIQSQIEQHPIEEEMAATQGNAGAVRTRQKSATPAGGKSGVTKSGKKFTFIE
jgi:hypothetical protein